MIKSTFYFSSICIMQWSMKLCSSTRSLRSSRTSPRSPLYLLPSTSSLRSSSSISLVSSKHLSAAVDGFHSPSPLAKNENGQQTTHLFITDFVQFHQRRWRCSSIKVERRSSRPSSISQINNPTANETIEKTPLLKRNQPLVVSSSDGSSPNQSDPSNNSASVVSPSATKMKKGHWLNINNQRQFFTTLAKDLGIDPPDNQDQWYKVKVEDVWKK